MGLSVINEKELAESIVKNLSPKLDAMQTRLEAWIAGLLSGMTSGSALRIRIPLGDGKVVEATVEILPKP